MRVLAVTDRFLTPDLLEVAVAPLRAAGHQVELRDWAAPSPEAQQQDILAIEQGGPGAIPPPDALAGPFDHDLAIVQFAPLSAAFFEAAAPRLRLVVVNRAGTENVDLDAADDHDVAVVHTPGRNARAVAEFTVGLLLAEHRNIARGHALLRHGTWARDYPNSGHVPELAGRVVGFVGYGRIARLVQRMLSGFDCRFLAHDPHVDPTSVPDDCGLVDLDDLLGQADVVSLHARLTPATEQLIGSRELGLMKPTAIVVNTARAGLVDEAALATALEAGTIAGAALDVFSREPAPADDPLVRAERTTVTPHLAGTTSDGFLTGPRLIAEHLRRYLAGDLDLPVVNDTPLCPPSASG